ncbi:hypothetical protein [Bacteroides faecium]|uniref:Uncharacterized protein n=1 Tax=Bacteroides faecium TaxID=2715212 RepID=A0A6H0KTH7_9BACE|nr:hypothetical protein [Bacteroides faecium]QIU96499.1 hypothetical protein BacF7301_21135 [Bacteroides faecium]
MEDKYKSSYLCSPIRKESGFAFFFYNYSFPFAREPEKRVEKKNKKNFRKDLAVKNKPLTFAPAFKTKATSSLKY